MNYKSIIRSQSLRVKILKLFNWVPDPVMLRIQYRIKMGFWPNFKHPKRFTEKLQLYKMCYRNINMPQCVDKYDVRKYVEGKGLGHLLNELLGVYNSFEEIDFASLPNQFVIKSTTGGGGLNIIVVKDKQQCDKEIIRQQIASWNIHTPGMISSGREWAYKNMPYTRIIIERYLEDSTGAGILSDYKLMIFNGRFKLLWIDRGRYSNHHRGFWDENLDFMPDVYSDHETFTTPPELPDNINEMIKVAEVLSGDFPYSRVDLYNCQGKIFFGEITFYPWSGYVKFTPDSFDIKLGDYFTLYQ